MATGRNYALIQFNLIFVAFLKLFTLLQTSEWLGVFMAKVCISKKRRLKIEI